MTPRNSPDRCTPFTNVPTSPATSFAMSCTTSRCHGTNETAGRIRSRLNQRNGLNPKTPTPTYCMETVQIQTKSEDVRPLLPRPQTPAYQSKTPPTRRVWGSAGSSAENSLACRYNSVTVPIQGVKPGDWSCSSPKLERQRTPRNAGGHRPLPSPESVGDHRVSELCARFRRITTAEHLKPKERGTSADGRINRAKIQSRSLLSERLSFV